MSTTPRHDIWYMIEDLEPQKPNADFMKYAKTIHDLYDAFTANGFTKQQAMHLTIGFMQTASK